MNHARGKRGVNGDCPRLPQEIADELKENAEEAKELDDPIEVYEKARDRFFKMPKKTLDQVKDIGDKMQEQISPVDLFPDEPKPCPEDNLPQNSPMDP